MRNHPVISRSTGIIALVILILSQFILAESNQLAQRADIEITG